MGKNGKIGHFYQERNHSRRYMLGNIKFCQHSVFIGNWIHIRTQVMKEDIIILEETWNILSSLVGDSTANANRNHSTCWKTSILSSILYICFFLSSMTDNLLLEG